MSSTETSTGVNWDSPTWGGGVHYADNGSWVTDRHEDKVRDDQ